MGNHLVRGISMRGWLSLKRSSKKGRTYGPFNLPRAIKAPGDAPPQVQKAFFKQVKLLELDLRHPSLHAKKYDAALDLWQA